MLRWIRGRRQEAAGSCEAHWELLSVYADGETTAAEAERIRKHVRDCVACAESLAYLAASSAALRRVPEIEPPTALRGNILLAASESARPRAAHRLFRLPALAVGAVASLAILFALLPRGDSGLRPPVRSASLPDMPILSANSPSVAPDIMPVAPDETIVTPAPRLASREAVPVPPPMLNSYPRRNPKASAGRHVGSPRVVSAKPVRSLMAAAARPDPVTTPRETPLPESAPEPNETSTVAARPAEPPPPAPAEPAPTVPPSPAHIQLVADLSGIPADQIATLGDLKRSLRGQKANLARFDIGRNFSQKQISVDLLKKSF